MIGKNIKSIGDSQENFMDDLAETICHPAVGVHVFCTVRTKNFDMLDDSAEISKTLSDACQQAGATVLNVMEHSFEPNGVTVLVMLAESHASIHTYPDQGCAFLDAFTCGEDIDPMDIIKKFCENYRVNPSEIKRVRREG